MSWRGIPALELVGLFLGLVSLVLSIHFYRQAEKASRTLDRLARRIDGTVTDIDGTLDAYRRELGQVRQEQTLRGLCLRMAEEHVGRDGSLTAGTVLRAAGNLQPGRGWWEVHRELMALRREELVDFDDPLTEESRLRPGRRAPA